MNGGGYSFFRYSLQSYKTVFLLTFRTHALESKRYSKAYNIIKYDTAPCVYSSRICIAVTGYYSVTFERTRAYITRKSPDKGMTILSDGGRVRG